MDVNYDGKNVKTFVKYVGKMTLLSYTICRIEKPIIDWIRTGKKALLIEGARQVGKTYIIRNVLESEQCDYIEFNLLKTPKLAALLEKSETVDDMITNLSLFSRKQFVKGKTFMDKHHQSLTCMKI